MASIEKRNGKYRVRYRDPIGPHRGPGRSPARPTPTASPARSRSTRTAAVDRPAQVGDLAAGVGRDVPGVVAVAVADVASRPTDGTSSCTSCRPSATAGSSRLNAEEIEQWLGDELAAASAPSSVHRHYRTLRRVLQTAVEKDRLLANPCAKVRPPRVPMRPMAILTWAQSVALAEAHPSGTSSR